MADDVVRDIPEEMVERVERAWPSVWFDHTDWRTKIRALLAAALAGRQVVDAPRFDKVTAKDVTFPGCHHSNPDLCACTNWEPPTCDACGNEYRAGDETYLVATKGAPFLSDDHPDQEWTTWTWHVGCDERAADSGSGED